MSDAPEVLNVKETAALLNLHVNTVRNMVKDGRLQTVNVPGSKAAKFDRRDIERMVADRGRALSSVAPSLKMYGPDLADAAELDVWGGAKVQRLLPELVRRLLTHTPGVTGISIRAGDGVDASGLDGIATSSGASFLPNGVLHMEFGTNEDPAGKAESDYRTRAEGRVPKPSSSEHFLFVTNRRWKNAPSWAAQKSAERKFASVKVIDADDLEGWLQNTPLVHVWISEVLGHHPSMATTLGSWWEEFRTGTRPPLPEAMFIAGRKTEAQALLGFADMTQRRQSVLVIQAGSLKEAYGFLAVTFAKQQIDALLIHTPEDWKRLVQGMKPSVVIPTFPGANIALAEGLGHKVVLPTEREGAHADFVRIQLPKPDRSGIVEAFRAAGTEIEQAEHYASLARRNLPSLVRLIALDPNANVPLWATDDDAASIFAVLALAGEWTTKADQKAIAKLAKRPWEKIEQTLVGWSRRDDQCFVMSGGSWRLVSEVEAADLLFGLIPSDVWDRWEALVVKVLLEDDPFEGMDSTERLVAQFEGRGRKYSPNLRGGLARSIAVLGSMGSRGLGRMSAQDRANRVVSATLALAATHGSWQRLHDVLPELAEGAPRVFLNAVDSDLHSSDPSLLGYFSTPRDEVQDPLGDKPVLLYLLWAMEGLAWSAEYFAEAGDALASLIALSPEEEPNTRGKTPLGSLTNVLLPWIRNTSAPLQMRIDLLSNLASTKPAVFWPLALELLPSGNSFSIPPRSPLFRDWKPANPSVSMSEWTAFVSELLRLLIQSAGHDLHRWAELIPHSVRLPTAVRAELLDKLAENLQNHEYGGEETVALWHALTKTTSRHREFPEAEWSLSEEELIPYDAAAAVLGDINPAHRYANLFSWSPSIPGFSRRRREVYRDELERRRALALEEILALPGLSDLERLATEAESPESLGLSLAAAVDDKVFRSVIRWLSSDNAKVRAAASRMVRRRLDLKGVEALAAALQWSELQEPAVRCEFVAAIPCSPQFWDALAANDDGLADEYWDRVSPWDMGESDPKRMVRELLVHGRPGAAIGVIAGASEMFDQQIPSDLIRSVLDQFIRGGSIQDLESGQASHQVGLVLDALQAAGDVENGVLAQYEFYFFPLLGRHERRSEALYRELRENPENFVELVTLAFRARNDLNKQLEDSQKWRARLAYEVLSEWRDIPGRKVDGSIDVDHLNRWVDDVRMALSNVDRAGIGDEQLGRVLSGGAFEGRGPWPAPEVRDLINRVGSPDLETGFQSGIFNSRGITSRGILEGGDQERGLVEKFRSLAIHNGVSTRTGRALIRVAESYEREALQADKRADRLQDGGWP